MRTAVRNILGTTLIISLSYLVFLAIRDRTSGEIVVHQTLLEADPKGLQDSLLLYLNAAFGSIGPQMTLQSGWISFSPGERRRRFELTMRGETVPTIYDAVFGLIDEKGRQIFLKKIDHESYNSDTANNTGEYTFIVAETTADLSGRYRFVSNLKASKAVTEIALQVRQDYHPIETKTALLLVGIIALSAVALVLVRLNPRPV